MPATRESTAAVIVAAGRGERAGGDRPKQWQALAGRPVLSHAVEAFSGFGRVVVVLHPDDMEKGVAVLGGQVTLVAGGTTRAASVHNALDLLDGSGMTHVLIHDGARPLVSRDIIDRVLGALDPGLAAAPALPVTDALWRGAEGNVAGAVARDGLFRAQTPQGFGLDAILAPPITQLTASSSWRRTAPIRAGLPTTWRSRAMPGSRWRSFRAPRTTSRSPGPTTLSGPSGCWGGTWM